MFQSTSQSKFVRGNRFQSRVPWAQGSSRAAHSEAGIRGHHSASATPARCVGRDTALGAQVCWQRHGPGGYPWAPHLKFQSTAKSRLTAAAPWRGRRGVCSWSNPQNQLGILLARVSPCVRCRANVFTYSVLFRDLIHSSAKRASASGRRKAPPSQYLCTFDFRAPLAAAVYSSSTQ